jgi:S1-C subfamily serine protease
MSIPTRSPLPFSIALALTMAALVAQDPSPENEAPAAPKTAEQTIVQGLDESRLAAALAVEQHFEDLARQAYGYVVSVTAHRRTDELDVATVREARADWIRDPLNITDYPGHDRIGIGSGVVVSEDGEILTCRHFLLDENGRMADIISVETPDQRHTICDVIAMEPTLDLALIKLRVYTETDPPKFKVATFGDSGTAKAGHFAFAIGNPVGPEQFFGRGVITTPPNRDCYQDQLSSTYLQIAVRVHPEAYGGPLINTRGETIGILLPRVIELGPTVEQPNLGIEFAMPSNIVKGIYGALRQVKSFRSPWLGFAVMSRTELRRELGPEAFNALEKPRFGIYLENVFAPSVASELGVEPGDFLTHFDGEVVYSPLNFQKMLYLAGIGAEVELEFFRDGQTFTRKFTVEERPAEATTR